MTNGDVQPPDHVLRGPPDASPTIYRANVPDVNQPLPSHPPDTPTPPSGNAPNATRAPEPMPLPDRHQAAIRHIQSLENHNSRLYEDNCKLVNAVNMLNDRLAYLGAPQNTQLQRLADVQERLRASDMDRALLHRKYQEMLQTNSAAVAQRHLNEELHGIREAYASLDKEYRGLADKYTRLKAVTLVANDHSRAGQHYSQGIARGLVPVARPELANTMQFRAHDQSRNAHPSPTSAISPGPLHPFVDHKENHRRRSSEGVMVQPSLRSGPSPVATTWLPHLPTPPPSAPLPMSQMSPTGFPVHASVPAASLPPPHPLQVGPDPRTLSRPLPVTQSHHLVRQGPPEQLTTAMPLRRRSDESPDAADKEPVPSSKETPAPASPTSGPRQLKRPSTEFQTVVSPGSEHKKPRIDEVTHSGTIDAVPYPSNDVPSTEPRDDHKLSAPDLTTQRSYQDCVNMIFEKDADVENGVFCGLCLDRHDHGMIPEPPDVLIEPDFDFLVRHCMTEHPTVWNDLRGKKA